MATAKFKIESGVQLLARLSKKQEIEHFYPVLFEGGLKHGNVVEVNSDNSSYLLIDILCEALVQAVNNIEPMGVLMFKTTAQFNFYELIKILEKRIKLILNITSDRQADEVQYNKVLQKTLSNFFLFDVYDATQFYTTIHNLDNILSKYSNISLLLFDTLTAFYWSEQGFKIIKMDMYVKNLLKMIQKVSKEYKVILFYTRPAYFYSSKDKEFETSDITDGVDYKVQLLENNKGIYEVHIKTLDFSYKKNFHILDNIINWQ